MYSFKTVHYVAFLNILVVLWPMCSTTNDAEVNSEFWKETLVLPLDLPEDNDNNHVKFVKKNSDITNNEEMQNNGGLFLKHWIREKFRHTENLSSIDFPVSPKRVIRQANSGYSSVYPTLPTKSEYGNYRPYGYNNATNSYPYGLPTNVTNRYNHPNPTRPDNYNWQNYNYQYPAQNGTNIYNPQYTNNPSGNNNNGMFAYNHPDNSSLNPYYPQPNSRPYYPGAPSNRTNPSYPQPTGRPFYHGATNNGTNPSYFQSTGRPFYPGALNNGSNPSYFQSTGRPSYPGTPNNGMNPSYPQPARGPYYSGGKNNSMNQNHSYPPSTGKPYYTGATNNANPVYPHSSFPNNSNYTKPVFGNVYNNISRPYNSSPSAPPYNTQFGYPSYNPTYNFSAIHGSVPGSQLPTYSNNSPYNTWGSSQGFGQNAVNPNRPNPPYGNYGTNPQPNQYNAREHNFYYPTQKNDSHYSHYDPRKNPPDHFSYPS